MLAKSALAVKLSNISQPIRKKLQLRLLQQTEYIKGPMPFPFKNTMQQTYKATATFEMVLNFVPYGERG